MRWIEYFYFFNDKLPNNRQIAEKLRSICNFKLNWNFYVARFRNKNQEFLNSLIK